MAFIKRLWKDRISEFPNRRTINDGNVTKQVTVGRDEGNITEEGDPFDASNMNDLEQRIEDAYGDLQGLVASEVAQQYDSANVIFDEEPTEGHGTGYTVTSEGIKTAIDSGLVHTKTVSGSIVHITDGADNIPVKNLEVDIQYKQSSGTPTPANPLPITTFNACDLSVCGVNLWDEVWELGYISVTDGTNSDSQINIRSKNYIPIKPNISLYIKANNNFYCPIIFYDKDKNFLSSFVQLLWNRTITTPENAYYARFYMHNSYGATYNNDISINYPSNDTQYHAYNGQTYNIPFGQTVGKGTLNVTTGELTITHGYILLGDMSWVYDGSRFYTVSLLNVIKKPASGRGADGIFCSNYLASTSGANETFFVYQTEVKTLLGENNIFSNCGDAEVTYYVDTEALYAIRDVIDEFAMQSDWNEADNTKADYIKNKPTIPANADFSLSGLSDTDISSASAGQVLTFDGDNWVNSNIVLPSIKYEEINVTFDASGEGTLFNSVKFVVGLKDIPSDQLYVGYVSYIAGSTIKIKALSRTAIAFSSQNNVSSTRKVGVYYLDNIATQ